MQMVRILKSTVFRLLDLPAIEAKEATEPGLYSGITHGTLNPLAMTRLRLRCTTVQLMEVRM